MGALPPNPRDFAALPPGFAGRRVELRSTTANPGRRAGAQVASPQSPTLRSGANQYNRLETSTDENVYT